MKLDLLILGLLMKQPMHGYEIHQKLSSEEMEQWVDIGFTSIYHALSRLKKSGLVVETIDRSSNKQKSIYRLTPSGREAFMEKLRCALADQRKLILDYNVPLYFINNLTPTEASMALRIRESFLRSWLSTLNEMPIASEESEPTIKIIIDHTKAIAEKEVEYLRYLADAIEGKFPEVASAPAADFMVLSGNLRDKPVSDLVNTISESKRSGTLILERGPKKCSIAFKEGKPTHISSSSLLNLMKGPLQAEKISKSVDGNLALRALDDVYDAFGWTEGSYVFDRKRSAKKEAIAIDISAKEMILEGTRRVDDWDRIRSVVPSDEAIFDRSNYLPNALSEIKLTEREQKTLDAINGVRDVVTISEICNTSVFETCKAIYTLSILGLVSLTPPDKARAVRAFREFARILLDRVYMIAGKKVLMEIETNVNNEANSLASSFRCRRGTVLEELEPGTSLTELIRQIKEFLSILVDFTSKHIGKAFAGSLIEPIRDKLPPDMAEDFDRYGFAEAYGKLKRPRY